MLTLDVAAVLRTVAATAIVNHTHVAFGSVAALLGVVGVVWGLLKRLLMMAVVALVLLLVGVVAAVVAGHGTHCTPLSTPHATHAVCITVR